MASIIKNRPSCSYLRSSDHNRCKSSSKIRRIIFALILDRKERIMFGLFLSMKLVGLDDLIIFFFSFLRFIRTKFCLLSRIKRYKNIFVICSFRWERFTQSTCMQQQCQLDELLSIDSRPMSDCGRQLTACRLISPKLDHKVHRMKTINFL